MIKLLYDPNLCSIAAFGCNQFAYLTGRGAWDASAIVAIARARALAAGRKIGVYCSDVFGAFDHVSKDRLVAKLKKKGVHPEIVAVLASWLEKRFAHVVVDCEASKVMELS